MLRFTQLIRVIEGTQPFSLNDIGCSCDALARSALKDFESFNYRGNDISEKWFLQHNDGIEEITT